MPYIEESPTIFSEKARLEAREKIKNVISKLEKSRSRKLSKSLYEQIMRCLKSHQDFQGGYETPILETAQEVADWYGVQRETVQRWKKKIDFPCRGALFDCWAIDSWLLRHGKVTEDYQIIRTRKFKKIKGAK
jgi:hypothetical protein